MYNHTVKLICSLAQHICKILSFESFEAANNTAKLGNTMLNNCKFNLFIRTYSYCFYVNILLHELW